MWNQALPMLLEFVLTTIVGGLFASFLLLPAPLCGRDVLRIGSADW